jgi:hypothetical protein
VNVPAIVSPWAPQRAQLGAVYGVSPFWAYLAAVSSALSAYHGYKRNLSVPWAVGWGLAGALFPVITPAVALAQGFGRRA